MSYGPCARVCVRVSTPSRHLQTVVNEGAQQTYTSETALKLEAGPRGLSPVSLLPSLSQALRNVHRESDLKITTFAVARPMGTLDAVFRIYRSQAWRG